MGTTTLGFPYPAATDPPAGHTQIQALAAAVDLQPGVGSFTQAQITGFSAGEKRAGRIVWNSTTGTLQRCDGSVFVDVVLASGTQTLAGKTLTTPTIADLTNATHNHSNAAGGGNIPESSVTNLVNDLAGKTASTLAVNAQTGTTYTFVAADAVSKLVTFSNASPVTATVPSATFAQGQHVPIVNKGAGAVTLTGSGVTLNGASLILAQYESVTLVFDSATVAYVVKGGGLPKASVSSTTGSPTTGANGSKTYYKWTGSGSVTLGQAGTLDVLLQAGGGGGNLGGGGAGQLLYVTSVYLAAGTYTVTVGAGGAAGTVGGLSLVGTGLIAVGGGAGAANTIAGGVGGNGGGGGGSGVGGASIAGGFAGGNGLAATLSHGGGGGTSAVGVNGATNAGGNGGAGTSKSITGAAVTYGGGGGGGTNAGTIGSGGAGGGGNGSTTTGVAGTANTGGGGGGGPTAGGIGGSGVVILLIG